ncbi:MAG: DUF1343 domain-containing protein [bacterium]|nr:DUF1343 domain-containing protein [bacterium]
MSRVFSGLDVLREGDLQGLGQRVGLLAHPASVASDLTHAVVIFREKLADRLVCLLGPQHGLYGETQDNMIEWEDFYEPNFGLAVHSLYGRSRKPQKYILDKIDTLIIDLQDVGARYYTFIWTMALCLEACAEQKVKVVVLDRPNPLGGLKVEGNVSSHDFLSFVGLYPLPVCHGLTIGELACLLNQHYRINAQLEVVWMEGWRRWMSFSDTGLPWVAPSPNMPGLQTARVYPGMCLLEGTNISEGRGTTLPFELFGAPFIQPWDMVRELGYHSLPGVVFRPCYFKPMFHKFQGELCAGAQVHITDWDSFKPYLTAIAILKTINHLYPDRLKWKLPPYEYEYEKLPIDILCGTDQIRRRIEQHAPLAEIEESWRRDLEEFLAIRRNYLHYE